MSKLAAITALAFVILLFRPSLALAHETATDGKAKAVIHIEPDDDPIIGQPAYFYFDFGGRIKRLSLSQCDCQAVITQGPTTIVTTKLSANTPRPTVPGFSYTFTEKGNYHLDLAGQPLVPGAFRPFHLSWDFPVTRLPGTPPTPERHIHSWLHYLSDYGFIGIFLISFIVLGARGKLAFQQKREATKTRSS